MADIFEPIFSPPASLPFAPGQSPFRQKGTAWLGDFALLADLVPGGMAAVCARLEPSVRSFVTGEFRAAEWYDVFPNPVVMQTAARIRGKSFLDHQRDVGVWHAKRGFGGVYRTLLRFVSNENVALWGPRVSSLYHEFGRFETRVAGPREVRGTRHGIPRGLVQWLMVTSGAFCEQALTLAGARSSRVEFGAPTPTGEQAGQVLYSVPLIIRWE